MPQGHPTSAFASASGLSRTMAMSISPPSLWIIVGRPAWISARIATALFSHKVRSHSSRALCARVSVCGGAFRAAGVPSVRMKGYQGERGMGNAEWPLLHVARHLFVHHMTWSFFLLMAGSESAHSCSSVYPGLGSSSCSRMQVLTGHGQPI